jgi:hypothetical protein
MDTVGDAEQEKSKWVYLDRAKAVAEIFAIIIGGLWAVKLYKETDVPAQEKRPSIQGDLKWTNKSHDSCLAEYTVTFKNVGKTDIDLALPTLTVWIAYQLDEMTKSKPVEYFDPQKVMGSEHILQRPLTEDEFAFHYPPDVGDTVTMSVAVRQNPGQILMFSLNFPEGDPDDLKDHKPKPNGKNWLDYRWGYACDESEVKQKRSTSLSKANRQ